jgi:uncharacterized protein (TIGR02271 family)
MSGAEPAVVTDPQGTRAQILATVRLVTNDEPVALLKLEDGEIVAVPTTALARQEDGGYRLGLNVAEPARAAAAADLHDAGPIVVPIMVEEMDVQKRVVETGRVRITKGVDEREEVIDEPLVRDEIEVERVPRDRTVDGPIPVRQVGDTTIVSLVAEELVVSKRFVLKEELHIRKRTVEAREPVHVTLRAEKAIVEHFDPRAARDDDARVE